MKEMSPPNNRVPNKYGEMKEVVKDLNNDVVYIDCCPKGCMLFFKEDADRDAYKFYGNSR